MYCFQPVALLLCVAVVTCYSAPPPPRGGGYREEEPRNEYHSSSRGDSTRYNRGPVHYPAPQHDREGYSSRSDTYAPNRIEEGGHNKGRTYGRVMEYTMNGPNQSGKMKVTETHVQMDRRMNGPEAEHAMKKIMGSMKSDAKSDFTDFVKDLGFENFGRY